MIVAVADIHAYYNKLTLMMSELSQRVNFDVDTLVFLGDYVDGGGNAKKVVTQLMQLHEMYPHWKFLMGNHEDMMLAGLGYQKSLGEPWYKGDYYLWWNQGGRATLDSYKRSFQASAYDKAIMQDRDYIPKKHLEWLADRDLYYKTEEFIFVHAGLAEGKQPEDLGPFPLLWNRDAFFTSDYDWGRYVVGGHTYHEEPLVKDNLMVIDTMHHGGGSLTAVILDEKKYRLDKAAKEWYTFIHV